MNVLGNEVKELYWKIHKDDKIKNTIFLKIDKLFDLEYIMDGSEF